ncbi:hypothetical protein HZH68_013621 [Vespula germanica]|uniref:Uncharacterized protein n=1 Tax=Vespula germanica TaxID=30212 RepID=A0A834JG57_VESGE|nr:hypothetical protein HZH68_013621 [Vespula germanica]
MKQKLDLEIFLQIKECDSRIKRRSRNNFEQFEKKSDACVPCDQVTKSLMKGISICKSLIKRNETEVFLKRLITKNNVITRL